MLSTGILLAIASSILWASFDIIRKKIGARTNAQAAIIGMMSLQMPMVLAIWALGSLIPDAAQRSPILFSGLPTIAPSYWLFYAGSLTVNLFANYLFMRSVQLAPLSLSTPYLSFTPVFTALLAYPLYSQAPNTFGWIGILIVCLGAFFLNPGNRADGLLAPLKALKTQRGSLYMVVVALLWSITPMFDKQAAGLSSALWHTGCLNSSMAVAFFIWRVTKERSAALVMSDLKRAAWIFPIAAACSLGALTTQLASYDQVEIAYVETFKRAIGLIGAMSAGYLLFGERDVSRRLLGALVMIIGVSFILLLR